MTTNARRGRDPEQHVVHNTPAEADQFTGLFGELSMVRDEDGITELRAHDALTGGGTVVKTVPADSLAAQLPNRLAVPPVDATVPADGILAVNHSLGYAPLVQALDEDGVQIFPAIVHDDDENVTLTFAGPGPVTVILA